jgi:hypothetical protein
MHVEQAAGVPRLMSISSSPASAGLFFAGAAGKKLPVFGNKFPFSFRGTFLWTGGYWPLSTSSGSLLISQWPVVGV